MTPAATSDLLEPDTWQVVTRAASAYTAVEPAFDVDGALADPDAVRELIRLLTKPVFRKVVRADGGPAHPLTSAAQDEAERAATAALNLMRKRADDARREKRAAKRGTAEERRQARLLADLSKARQDRTAALEYAAAQDTTIATLRTTIGELDEALAAETRQAEIAVTQLDAVRADLDNPAALAGHLATALEDNPAPLLSAAQALIDDPTEVLKWFAPLLREIANPTVTRARQAARALAVDMLGGGVEVGGSCALVTADDTRILVDAGTRPNSSAAEGAPPRIAEALDGDIHAIVITHAHADHCGWVPAILAQRPDIPVYATAATADLLPTMWVDAARIYRREPGPAPFSEAEARSAVRNLHPIAYDRAVQVGDLSFSLFPAGHIVGAAGVHVTDGTHTAVITGDISGEGQKTVGGYRLPPDAYGADLLVMESTYGASTTMPARDRVVADFIKDISVIVSGGGRVLVPAFALGRAQEIALLVAEHLPHVPVRIDGLARDITRIYQRHTGADGKELSILSDKVQPVPAGRTSDTVETFTNGVIITTSGMLSGGPAITWAGAILPDPNSALMIVGYQDPNSPGGRLVQLAQTRGTFTLTGADGVARDVEVNAKVTSYGLGAHASPDELVELATKVRAKATMLVHGDVGARQRLAERLNARHLATVDAADGWKATPGS